MAFFSVITVTYNSGPWLRQTIESVLAQQYTDFELIIGDDGSGDDTWAIIGQYDDPRIKSYRNEDNLGEYANRNKAIARASGKYLIFIDGDDLMYDHALQVFHRYAQAFPQAAMFFCREWDPRVLCPFEADPRTLYRFEYLDGGIMGGNFTNVLFKTDILRNTPFKTGIRTGDTYIQLKIAQQHSGVVIPGGLTWWRRRSGNATSNFFSGNRHMAETFNYRMELLDAGCPLPPEEIEKARSNMYGIFTRSLFRIALKGRLGDFFYLIRRVAIPFRYYFTFFKRADYRYYGSVTGDRPLHTAMNGRSKNITT